MDAKRGGVCRVVTMDEHDWCALGGVFLVRCGLVGVFIGANCVVEDKTDEGISCFVGTENANKLTHLVHPKSSSRTQRRQDRSLF